MSIINGKDLSFGQSSAGLPNVLEGILNYFQPVRVGLIKTTQVNGYTQTIVEEYIDTRGVRIQTPNAVVYTKTGERIWDTLEIYFTPDIILTADCLFLFEAIQYRVVKTEDWTEYGFNKYVVIQDYTKLYQVDDATII